MDLHDIFTRGVCVSDQKTVHYFLWMIQIARFCMHFYSLLAWLVSLSVHRINYKVMSVFARSFYQMCASGQGIIPYFLGMIRTARLTDCLANMVNNTFILILNLPLSESYHLTCITWIWKLITKMLPLFCFINIFLGRGLSFRLTN